MMKKKYNDIPKVTSDDENLIKYQEFCKKYLGQKIDYELGEDSFTVSPEELSTMFDSSLSGKASTEGVKEYVKQLAEKYELTTKQIGFILRDVPVPGQLDIFDWLGKGADSSENTSPKEK